MDITSAEFAIIKEMIPLQAEIEQLEKQEELSFYGLGEKIRPLKLKLRKLQMELRLENAFAHGIDLWKDISRTYTPAERQLATRLDCSSGQLTAAKN